MEALEVKTAPKLDQWRSLLEKILSDYAKLPYRYGDVATYLVVGQDRNHFLLMQEGWEENNRVHGCLVHAEIRNQKIWIHYDGIEGGIANELTELGVPKDHIVLAFHAPTVRQYTGYAID
ncbi:XisI protein [Limnothrix sp. FACHB-1083]|uniref:XisI protein n=1 Tax=unclassified Limnothrix TaxID=2632864 RepID=UPI0016806DA6|nr:MULTISPECIES: XisI protein [unclassified Limnothrix]MBD2160059.1 XisI protein [Limnothrix sp. FACHB-1083]MBD2190761.1 XisI protein [Limnothrix sp. FACHB-1088]